ARLAASARAVVRLTWRASSWASASWACFSACSRRARTGSRLNVKVLCMGSRSQRPALAGRSRVIDRAVLRLRVVARSCCRGERRLAERLADRVQDAVGLERLDDEVPGAGLDGLQHLRLL